MKKFITLLLTGTMLLSMPVLANDDDYTGAINQVKVYLMCRNRNLMLPIVRWFQCLNWEIKVNG